MSKPDAAKAMRQLVRELIKLGCHVRKEGKHTKVTGPNGRTISLSVTPSSNYAATNARREVRATLELDV